ncbi:hypothetical protein GCM10027168_36680 [Streptomyces capparidis]
MSRLADALTELLDFPGLVTAVLVDGVTGLEYGSAGDRGALPDAAALCEEVRRVSDTALAARAEGEVEGLVLTTARRHHLTRVLPRAHGDPLLLAVALDRGRTNLALAVREIDARAGRLLA